ncbi:MAG: prolyl oligopeptidase family serine peptidase [Gemmatimonadetes bacterium]|nr:prolyl oligopeptidase family serine peptidase [Gemmatimonadota bacterium]
MKPATRLTRIHFLLLGLPLAALSTVAPAQQVVLGQEQYMMPPAPIADFLLSDRANNVNLSNLGPDGKHFLITKSGGMTPLELMARPYVNLGETALDHVANRSRGLSIGYSVGFEFFSYEDGGRTVVDVPDGLTVSGARWSPDGSKIAFMAHGPAESHIYVANVADGRSKQVTSTPLAATLVTSFNWTQDSKQILTALIPKGRGPMPLPSPVANEPRVWVFREGEVPTRTYRFLLKTPYDMELLEHLSTSQLALIDVDNGSVTEIGDPGMFTSIGISTDGEYVRVSTMLKPFSYFHTRTSFGSVDELWDLSGNAVHEFSKRELGQRRGGGRGRRGGGGGGGGGDGKRSISWRPDGQGMSFLQMEPRPESEEGDDAPAAQPARRGGGQRGRRGRRGGGRGAPQAAEPEEDDRKDRVMQWLPPYDDDSMKVVWESDDRIQSVQYSQDCQTLFITQTIDDKRQLFAVDLTDPDAKRMILDGNDDEEGEDDGPTGNLMTKRGQKGGTAVRVSTDGGSVYFSGTQRFDDPLQDAPRPFIDKVSIGSGDKERIFQSDPDVYETVVAPVDDDLKQIFTSRQAPRMVPNTFLRTLETDELTQLTDNVDYAPDVTAARRERFQVTRVDGYKFWVNVTIPRHYGQYLPAMFWFYPREYTSQEQYDERGQNYNKNSFPNVGNRSMSLLTLLGYVVVEPDAPIFGEPGRMNDNYVADLRNGLWAVIDGLDKRQIIDRDRLGIGGHSYGAFGTANAMAHTPFFKAGIAGDGNYNRTLTPMAFQSERRYIWDARETYIAMSPLLWANQINGALLMYHGMDDNNSGTFPIHSPRLFAALDGLGKPVTLYQYPYEGHGPRGRGTILDLWARWCAWLDIYVKGVDDEADVAGRPNISVGEGRIRRR